MKMIIIRPGENGQPLIEVYGDGGKREKEYGEGAIPLPELGKEIGTRGGA